MPMCGRFSLEVDDSFYPRFEIEEYIEIKPNYNIAPYSNIPVIIKKSPKQILNMKWGFIPSWSKEYSTKYAVINTRAETIEDKPYYRDAFKSSRCLIPATGFYEWKEENDEKIPYYFHLKDNSYFSFAGIYSIWKSNDGKEVYTCSIITTEPNSIVKDIHDRMPVILSKEEEDIWIDRDNEDEKRLKNLLNPYESKYMEAYEVSNSVNSPKNNGKEVIDPV